MSERSLDISKYHCVIMVFVMNGCGACEDFLPKLHSAATVLIQRGLPILVYQADDPRPDVQALMNQYDIQATPTTLLLIRGPGSLRYEGSLEPTQISELLAVAGRSHRR